MRFDFIVVQLKSTHSSTLIHILTENLSDLVTDCDVLDYIFRDRDSFLTFHVFECEGAVIKFHEAPFLHEKEENKSIFNVDDVCERLEIFALNSSSSSY